MLIVLSYFAGDRPQAIDLAQWIKQLGGVAKHDCLLVVDRSTTELGVIEPLRDAFRSVKSIPSEPAGEQGAWGKGTTNAEAANEGWLTAKDYIYHVEKRPWGWIETDVAPTRSTWLDEWEAEYLHGRKPFMGAYVNIPPHDPHMSGIGVYPADVAAHALDMVMCGTIAWDYAGRKSTVGGKKAHFTNLIQHEYRINGESPTFPTLESLSVIKPVTAVFHRCKDFSLIARLREKMGIVSAAVATVVPSAPLAAAAVSQADEITELKKQLAELTAKMNCQERLRPAIEQAVASKPPFTKKQMKKKRTLSPEHKAKLMAGRAKQRAYKLL